MATNPYDFMSDSYTTGQEMVQPPKATTPQLATNKPPTGGTGELSFGLSSSSRATGPSYSSPYGGSWPSQPAANMGQQSQYPSYGGGMTPYQPSQMPQWNTSFGVPGGNPTQQRPTYNAGSPLNMPTVGAQNPGAGEKQPGYGNTMDYWRNVENQQAMNAWLPNAQYEQNRYQYAQDFNEAQRRYNEQFGWTQQSDAFNMGLAQRQQTAAEWQAQEAAKQWGAQFGYTQAQDNRTWDLSNRQFGLDTELGRGNLANQQQITANTGAYQTGQLANQQQEIANTGAYQTGQLANTARGLDITDWFNRSQAANQQQANDIDRMYKTGQLDLGQRNAALAELTQSQNIALAQLTQQQQNEQAYANMANQLKMANVSAYGRVQAPNTRWQRSWG